MDTLPASTARALGLCVGATTVSLVVLQNGCVAWQRLMPHGGDYRRAVRSVLAEAGDIDGMPVAVTGRKFRRNLTLPSLSEPEAVELAYGRVLGAGHPCRTIIAAGGETFMVYRLDEAGRIMDIRAGNKCASGTGEFLVQQLRRVGVEPGGLADLPLDAEPHPVSGRCSVFCKSDCTHALNKGVPRLSIIAGLTRMMAGKCLELLKNLPRESVMLTGGCAANKFMVNFLRAEVGELIIPEQAACFEALGAAVWASQHDVPPFPGLDGLFAERGASFGTLPPLARHTGRVTFKTAERAVVRPDESPEVILGLDVGSTTTKGVLMRRADKAILASVYLRTLGDPIGAARQVYAGLSEQLNGARARITGLGVTGSGRRIAGLHAGTEGVINEIVAHAEAAVHFDPEVDTIFEIGGQDAKYTYIVNGSPADYAMNEACGAGTGSFLEESAQESLGVDVRAIGPLALEAQNPPNFSDQCAAFIASDIKTAAQENFPQADILAGLVYSVCMNYQNRVKGHRPVGRKVFMQGGVCYNPAVPVAMAGLLGKDIVVPPEPGLMGAFGVALAVDKRMAGGEISPGAFDLDALKWREARHKPPFRCRGGRGACDRGCEIARIEIDGHIHPFGGVCNRYENLHPGRKRQPDGLDLVTQRERRVFRDLAEIDDGRPTVGLNRSFLVNAWFPFFNAFFRELGWRVVLPDTPDPAGIERRGAAFCHPVELAHGYFANLLAKRPDRLFLPHIAVMPDADTTSQARTCVFLQGEPYYLRTAFGLDPAAILSPRLDLGAGPDALRPPLTEVAASLGHTGRTGRARLDAALAAALAAQADFQRDVRAMCAPVLDELSASRTGLGVVLFGRPYNALAAVANKAIPAKFATRGIHVLPPDGLPLDDIPLPPGQNMYWGLGRQLMRAAVFTSGRPDLYGAYITNFSCGPDSFLLTYFRDLLGRKPSLTLELDSHTADAGIETRVEAFLDIAAHHRRESARRHAPSGRAQAVIPAEILTTPDGPAVRASDGSVLPLAHPRVHVVLPNMGEYGTRFLAGAFAKAGIRATALPPADEAALKLGRGHSTCKECLPLQTTAGTLLTHLERRPSDEVTVYFMPGANGPCRFGQYAVFSRRLIAKGGYPNAAVISPCAAQGYAGLGDKLTLALYRGVAAGDLFNEMRACLLAAAQDPVTALDALHAASLDIARLMGQPAKILAQGLTRCAARLAAIPLRVDPATLPRLSLVGEIYVRHDTIALQNLIERLAAQGFVVHTSPVLEWMRYTDWLISSGLSTKPTLGFHLRRLVKAAAANSIRRRLLPSGLILSRSVDIQAVTAAGARFISPHLHGEAILTVGAAWHDILKPSCGIISIGPFGCMPSRLSEAILSENFTARNLPHAHLLPASARLPFLALETDGGPFPQIIEARLEAFCLQAARLHAQLSQR